MREIDRIVDELQRAFDGDAWHGPSVRAALEGVDLAVASTRPAAGHTICEIVLHMTAWTREIARRLRIGIAQDPEEGDWPQRTVATDAEWSAIVSALDQAQAELIAICAGLDDEQLDARIGDARDRPLGAGVSRYVTLHGLAQHYAYHGGQISLLKQLHAAARR